MANIYSVKSGLASDPTVWSGGVVPVSGDRVLIHRPGNIGISIATIASTHVAGETQVVLGTGTVTASTFGVGGSVCFGSNSNTCYEILGWNHLTKTLTITPLLSDVPPSTNVISVGHVIELDGVYGWGDDSTASVTINAMTTTNSITVNGTLRASRTVSSQLICNGQLFLNSNGGTYDAGTASDPIPYGVNHTITLNKSATLGPCKYGFLTTGVANALCGARLFMHGHYRRRNAVLVGAVAIGATSAEVSDATGWKVGDEICFAPTTTALAVDRRTITGITPTSGTAAVLTFAALTFAHMNGSPVGNFTSNILVTPFDATVGAGATFMFWGTSHTAGNYPGILHVENVKFIGTGGDSAFSGGKTGILGLGVGTIPLTANVADPLNSCVFFAQVGSSAGTKAQFVVTMNRTSCVVNDFAFYNESATYSLYESSVRYECNGMVVYTNKGTSTVACANYSGGSTKSVLNNPKFFGCLALPVQRSQNATSNSVVNSPVFGPLGNIQPYVRFDLATNLIIRNADYGYTFGKGMANAAIANATATGFGYMTDIDGKFAAGLEPKPLNYNLCDDTSFARVVNKGGDPSAQETHRPNGSVYRDNTIRNRSLSSIRMVPDTGAIAPHSYEVEFLAASGVTQTIVGYLRKNASYGAGVQPSVKVSGLGIPEVVYTMSSGADTWEKFTINVTQNTGVDGILSMEFIGASTSAGAACWLDGIVSAPFVTKCRHYGYKFQETSVVREINPVVQLSESEASALTGISLSANTLTLTESRSIREIYDWYQFQMVSDLSLPDAFTSTDGVNFNCAFDLVIDGGAITGDGAISMPSKTLTVSNGGTSTAAITHNAGVFTSITVTDYTVGARLQVFNVTTGTELYNDIPGSGTLSLPVNWTTDQTIRVRMARVVGLDADALIQTFGVLSSKGASFLLTPEPDVVYEANAIDGDAVTEFTADFPNVQIDVNDLDGATTPQRGYAWYMSGQMTADGIAAFHGGMSADDTANYRINVNVLDMRVQNVSTQPCIISGARLYRSDGTSIFATGVGPIQADPSKAYLSGGSVPSASTIASTVLSSLNATTIPVDVKKMNGATLLGTGIESDKWRG